MINHVASDSAIVFNKQYDSVSGRVVVTGQLDNPATMTVLIRTANNTTGPAYRVSLPKGEVKQSLDFDIYDETTVKLLYNHGRATEGKIQIDLTVPRAYL